MPNAGEIVAPNQQPSTEERIRDRLAMEVYRTSEVLRILALKRLGLDEERLQPGVRAMLTLESQDTHPRHITVKLSTDSQLRLDESDLRQVSVHERNSEDSENDFTNGRFIKPDGKMWQMADSSQGEPWYPAPLEAERMVKMIDCLETMANSDFVIGCELSAYRQHPRHG